ncbi:MAG: hypothetical protein Hyperionvirus15_41 [Hyperionvirus sp.]|uniref:Uncharacterized protein n=1 Tax=Hyperionvirus sp. TaxID=2487770 RepID=A0A3G5ADP3_9VIRU|nr:MAG: hypothetical protein Hyperionvirus15_41 [Hyperionvirus sp.]
MLGKVVLCTFLVLALWQHTAVKFEMAVQPLKMIDKGAEGVKLHALNLGKWVFGISGFYASPTGQNIIGAIDKGVRDVWTTMMDTLGSLFKLIIVGPFSALQAYGELARGNKSGELYFMGSVTIGILAAVLIAGLFKFCKKKLIY